MKTIEQETKRYFQTQWRPKGSKQWNDCRDGGFEPSQEDLKTQRAAFPKFEYRVLKCVKTTTVKATILKR